MASPLAKSTKIALLQFKATGDIQLTLAKTRKYAERAIKEQPDTDIIVLPELFNCLLKSSYYKKVAEPIPGGVTTQCLSKIAKTYKVNIVGGSYPELDSGDLYNTSVVFNREGEIIAKHRKVHLFDVAIGNAMCMKESDTFKSGNKATAVLFDGIGTCGIAICHDIKFPELAIVTARPVEQGGKGAGILMYPSAFSTVTGPVYWHKFAVARAVDNQVYVVMSSAARDDTVPSYMSYGHSLVIDPYGNVVVETGIGEEIVYCELKPEVIVEARTHVPLNDQRRYDVYPNVAAHSVVNDL